MIAQRVAAVHLHECIRSLAHWLLPPAWPSTASIIMLLPVSYCSARGLSKHASNSHSRAQVKPLPMKSALQVHARVLPLLVQLASALQPPLLVGHGSTPENTEHVDQRAGAVILQRCNPGSSHLLAHRDQLATGFWLSTRDMHTHLCKRLRRQRHPACRRMCGCQACWCRWRWHCSLRYWWRIR